MQGQDGLLHVKFAQTQMVTNEFWGKPNSKSPWSLWKVNTLLGRKAITAGWKAKSPPPFHPVYELMLDLTLPANILDGFRIYSSKEKVEDRVEGIQTIEEIEQVAEKVLNCLCSGRRVAQLRCERPSKRDVPLENICLFNRDSLHLRQLKYAIKRGDVGAVLDLITHSMLAFHGTGKTPKYADALFSMVVHLKRMDPKVWYVINAVLEIGVSLMNKSGLVARHKAGTSTERGYYMYWIKPMRDSAPMSLVYIHNETWLCYSTSPFRYWLISAYS